jgi:hypothetical protein
MLSAPNPNLSMSQNTHFPEHIPHIHSPLIRSFPTHAMLANRPRDRQPEAAHASSPTGPSPKDSAAATGPSILGGGFVSFGGDSKRSLFRSRCVLVGFASGRGFPPSSSETDGSSMTRMGRTEDPTIGARNAERSRSARNPIPNRPPMSKGRDPDQQTPKSRPRIVGKGTRHTQVPTPRRFSSPCGLLLWLANDARGISLGGRGAASRPRQHKV